MLPRFIDILFHPNLLWRPQPSRNSAARNPRTGIRNSVQGVDHPIQNRLALLKPQTSPCGLSSGRPQESLVLESDRQNGGSGHANSSNEGVNGAAVRRPIDTDYRSRPGNAHLVVPVAIFGPNRVRVPLDEGANLAVSEDLIQIS